MAEIKVSSELLRQAASDIKQQYTTFTEIAADIEQGVGTLSSTWEGDAFTSFKAKFDTLKPTLESYGQVIQEYAAFLETSAEQYETTEAANQSSTDALENTLFQ
ncbi:MAG: WXG100 family type VII secretion target [Clostridiales bacterium]|nr:WXG100 family type VII secretion target [Clostridiales bacterium]